MLGNINITFKIQAKSPQVSQRRELSLIRDQIIQNVPGAERPTAPSRYFWTSTTKLLRHVITDAIPAGLDAALARKKTGEFKHFFGGELLLYETYCNQLTGQQKICYDNFAMSYFYGQTVSDETPYVDITVGCKSSYGHGHDLRQHKTSTFSLGVHTKNT